MMPVRRGPRLVAAAALAGVFALLVLPSFVTALPVSPGAGGTARPDAALSARALWNGQSIAAYPSVSSALAMDFSKVIDLRFFWNATAVGGAPAPVTVGDGRLQMFYFGFALSTRDVVVTNPTPGPSGTLDMKWDPSVLRYVVSGVYLVTASLLDPNGTTLWSENFYVRAAAPYVVVAALPILLIVLAIYEAYSLAVSGRYERSAPPPPEDSRPSESRPPPSPPPGGGA